MRSVSKNRNKYTSSKLVEEIGHCELCGSKSNLEVHHIVPMTLNWAIPNVNLDTEENMIVICGSCHARLTVRSLLTKIGQQRARRDNNMHDINKKFYEMCMDEMGDECISAREIMDIHDKWLQKYLIEIND